MGLREEKKQATRSAIVDACLTMFRERGFDDTRVHDVTSRLRISEGTFFNYFPTKQSVLEEAGVTLIDQTIAALQAQATSDVTVPERLLASAHAFAATFAHDRVFAELLAAHTTFFAAVRTDRLARVHALLTDLFGEGQAAGDIRSDIAAPQLANAFLAVTTSMVQGWVLEEGGESLEKRLVDAASVIVSGCATTRPAAAPSA